MTLGLNRNNSIEKRSGITLIELVVIMAILAVLVGLFGEGFMRTFRSLVGINNQIDALMDVQGAMGIIETDLEEMTRVDQCEAAVLVFQWDSNRMPGYNPNADSEPGTQQDGIPNRFDVDDDGDMTNATGGPVPGTIFNGNDLWDQDDDNNNEIDVQVRYQLINGNLFRDINYNGQGWGFNERFMLRGVIGNVFEYFGSVQQIPGAAADLNGDGIVTRIEIDAPPIGNGNGIVDTPSEINHINHIEVSLAQDRNGDGVPEFFLRSRVKPPLLTTNRRVM